MLKRKSTAVWKGEGATGQGTLESQSGALVALPYSANARFVSEDGKAGTNPEELIAAAHAGCYAMALSFGLTKAGHPPTELRASATVSMEKGDAGWSIIGIALDVEGIVSGVTAQAFTEYAEAAKKGCPVSRALAATPITLTARLAR